METIGIYCGCWWVRERGGGREGKNERKRKEENRTEEWLKERRRKKRTIVLETWQIIERLTTFRYSFPGEFKTTFLREKIVQDAKSRFYFHFMQICNFNHHHSQSHSRRRGLIDRIDIYDLIFRVIHSSKKKLHII